MSTRIIRTDNASIWFVMAAVLLSSAALYAGSANRSRVTGTYSSMYFHQQGGDLLGQELRIVRTRKGYQGALQFAEGAPSNLIVVDIKLTGNNIEFTIPDSYPEAGQFSGTISPGVIRGTFKFKTGGHETVELKKGKSYWD